MGDDEHKVGSEAPIVPSGVAPADAPHTMQPGPPSQPAAPPHTLAALLIRLGMKKTEETQREVTFGPGMSEYCTNYIITSKYNVINFFPKSIFEQFRRLGNQYFLLMAILMCIGTYTTVFDSPIGPATTIGPLCLVLLVSLAQEGLSDLKRHRSDDEVNNTKAEVLNVPGKDSTRWRDIRVGNLLLVRNGGQIPADMAILATSEEEGICYIETSQIDGETNLKLRRSPQALFGPSRMSHEEIAKACASFEGRIECEPPNVSINTFTGRLLLPGKGLIPLGAENFLLRGAALRNTEWMVGAVVYTGPDTKIIRNSREAPSKLSQVDRAINTCVQLIFLADILLVTLSAGLYIRWQSNNFDRSTYLGYYSSSNTDAGYQATYAAYDGMDWQTTKTAYWQSWLTFLVLYNNFIPISLYVTVEVVVFALLYLVSSDLQMYHEGTDTPAKARSSNITDLGQIQYIFSDKTGTLTQNVMRFKRASVAGIIYGAPIDSETPGEQEHPAGSNGSSATLGMPYKALLDLPAAAHGDGREHYDQDARSFLEVLALAHTVVVEKSKDGGEGFVYQAESPDEGALVDFARDMGYELLARNSSTITIKVKGKQRVERVLAVNKFDSDRKRMSMVLQVHDGTYRLLCKGADSSMLSAAANVQEPHVQLMQEHLEVFASEGLRTLVLAEKQLSEQEFNEWYATYKAATEALEGRDDKLSAAASKIEHGMFIVGATAIEDKLQDEVPDTIACLAEAGIKLWVLTGDKRETAINIGHSCKLLTSAMYLKILRSGTEDEVCEQLAQLYHDMAHGTASTKPQGWWEGRFGNQKQLHQDMTDAMNKYMARPEQLKRTASMEDQDPTGKQPAFIMEGPALLHVLGDVTLEAMLFQVASKCNAVIACRVSPKQKAVLVRLVKQYVRPKPVTLSIGDGANDVPMLQEAQVGIGVSGNEGQQAVNNSDFAIAQFRFLKPLLLVHGRWNYRRMSLVVLYSFFKNMVLVVTLFLFSFYAGFSGTALYEDNLIGLFNFFLGLPIIGIGIFDKDVSAEYALTHPQMYASGRDSRDLNKKVILRWISYAIVCGVLIFYIPYTTYTSRQDKDTFDLKVYGTTVFSCLIIAMNYKVLLETRTITYCSGGLCIGGKGGNPGSSVGSNGHMNDKAGCCSNFGWTVFFILGSIAFYFISTIIYAGLIGFAWTYYWAAMMAYRSQMHWLLVFLVPIILILIDVLVKFVMNYYYPDDVALGIEEDRAVGTGKSAWGKARIKVPLSKPVVAVQLQPVRKPSGTPDGFNFAEEMQGEEDRSGPCVSPPAHGLSLTKVSPADAPGKGKVRPTSDPNPAEAKC